MSGVFCVTWVPFKQTGRAQGSSRRYVWGWSGVTGCSFSVGGEGGRGVVWNKMTCGAPSIAQKLLVCVDHQSRVSWLGGDAD